MKKRNRSLERTVPVNIATLPVVLVVLVGLTRSRSLPMRHQGGKLKGSERGLYRNAGNGNVRMTSYVDMLPRIFAFGGSRTHDKGSLLLLTLAAQ
jgi:hypothetical protein